MNTLPESLKQKLHQIDMNHRRPVEDVMRDADKVRELKADYPEWDFEIEMSAKNMVSLSMSWNEFMQKGAILA